jgi:hypothetical protein
MNYQHAPDTYGTAKTRNLLAEASEELERLEIETSQASRRLTVLAEALARLERMAVSHKPEVVKAVANDAAAARRESQLLLSYVSTSEWSLGYLRNLVDFLALGL